MTRDAKHLAKHCIIRLGFPATLWLHDLRRSHETIRPDAGASVHVVADRCGHDPATLLRAYAKRTKTADARRQTASASAMQKYDWPEIGRKPNFVRDWLLRPIRPDRCNELTRLS